MDQHQHNTPKQKNQKKKIKEDHEKGQKSPNKKGVTGLITMSNLHLALGKQKQRKQERLKPTKKKTSCWKTQS